VQSLTGQFRDIEIDIPQDVSVTLGAGGEQEVQISVIDTPMTIAASEKDQTAAEEQKARESNTTALIKERISPLVLCTPEGSTFAPPIRIKISYDENSVRRSSGARVAVFKWYPQLSIWVEVPNSRVLRPGVMSVETNSFSIYSVFMVPQKAATVALGAAAVDLSKQATVLSPTEFFSVAPITISLDGDYAKVGLAIPAGVTITFPVPGVTAISVAVQPASLAQLAAVRRRTGLFGSRRAMLSTNIVEFGPDGTMFSPPVNITLVFDASMQVPSGEYEAISVWNDKTLSWDEKPGTFVLEPGVATVETTTFSQYAVLTLPFDKGQVNVPSSTTPLPSGEDVEQGLSMPILIAMAVGVTLVLLLALALALYLRRRAAIPSEDVKDFAAVGLQRKGDQQPTERAKTEKKARRMEPVADAFEPYDHVSAVEATEALAEQPGAGEGEAVLDASVLALAQQLADSDSAAIAPLPREQVTAEWNVEPDASIGIASGAGLSPDEMASLLAGLAAAEKIQAAALPPAHSVSQKSENKDKDKGKKKNKRAKRGAAARTAEVQRDSESAIREGQAAAASGHQSLSSAAWARPAGARNEATSSSDGKAAAPAEAAPAEVETEITLGSLGLTTSDAAAVPPPLRPSPLCNPVPPTLFALLHPHLRSGGLYLKASCTVARASKNRRTSLCPRGLLQLWYARMSVCLMAR